MIIKFSGKYARNPETFGIDFEASVDDRSVTCSVSMEALQDIDPNNSSNTAEQQFVANQSKFQALAERKIRASAVTSISITTADVRAGDKA